MYKVEHKDDVYILTNPYIKLAILFDSFETLNNYYENLLLARDDLTVCIDVILPILEGHKHTKEMKQFINSLDKVDDVK